MHDSQMRKQYYFRTSSRGLLSWDVDRLIHLSHDLPRRMVPLSAIRELDEAFFEDVEQPTWRQMLEHMRLIEEADLSFPIIMSGWSGHGWHAPCCKAALQGRIEIEAVQFVEDPAEDHVGRGPDELPY